MDVQRGDGFHGCRPARSYLRMSLDSSPGAPYIYVLTVCLRIQEDLDLVAYSSLPSLQAPQGMPLKAVYQDAVVGIRYQHPRVSPPGTTPVGYMRLFDVV